MKTNREKEFERAENFPTFAREGVYRNLKDDIFDPRQHKYIKELFK